MNKLNLSTNILFISSKTCNVLVKESLKGKGNIG